MLHRVPGFRGRSRLVTTFNRAFNRAGARPVVEAPMRLGHRMLLDLRGITEVVAFYTGDFDTSFMEAVFPLLPRDAVVFDIGANIGFYAVPLASRVARVYAVEPFARNRERLRENLRLNRVDATILEQGLSDKSGTARLTLRDDFQKGADTGNAAIWIDDGTDARFRAVEIALETLDSVAAREHLARLDYIKIDVEGHEDAVFAGGRETLRRFRPLVQAEANLTYFERKGVDVDAGVFEVFRALDYAAIRPGPGGWRELATLKGRGVTDDVLFVPRERLSAVLKRLAE